VDAAYLSTKKIELLFIRVLTHKIALNNKTKKQKKRKKNQTIYRKES